MSRLEKISGFISRHAESAKYGKPHEEYISLTPEGVKQARERARSEILEIIQEAPEGAVIFIGGGSDQLRTRETGEIYGEELNRIVYEDLKGISDVEVITKRDIEEATTPTYHQVLKKAQETSDERELRKIAEDLKQESYAMTLQQIEEIIKENPDKKIVVDYPVRLWGFSYGYKAKGEEGGLVGEPRWIDEKTGKASDFFATVVREKGNDEGGQIWIRQGGEYTDQSGRVLKGPKPIEVAKEYLAGLVKLQEFAKKHTDKPLVIGGVGHSWDIDALATWLSLGCPKEISSEDFYQQFMKISQGGEIIKETEMVRFEINADGVKIKYRGKEYLSGK